MKGIVADTHTFLWYLFEPQRLSLHQANYDFLSSIQFDENLMRPMSKGNDGVV